MGHNVSGLTSLVGDQSRPRQERLAVYQNPNLLKTIALKVQ